MGGSGFAGSIVHFSLSSPSFQLLYISDWTPPAADPTDPLEFFVAEVVDTIPMKLDFNVSVECVITVWD